MAEGSISIGRPDQLSSAEWGQFGCIFQVMATATAKIVLRSRPNADGTHPLIIKILKNGVPSIITTGQSIHKSDWDAKKRELRKSHPNSVRLNQFLMKKRSEVVDISLELETKNSEVSAKEVRDSIKPPAETLFFAQALSYLNELRDSRKYNQYTANKPRIRHFKDFTLNPKTKGLSADEKKKIRQENKLLTDEQRDAEFKSFLLNRDIAFTLITPGLLDKFTIYLKGLGDKGKRTIMNHLAVIRSFFCKCRKK